MEMVEMVMERTLVQQAKTQRAVVLKRLLRQ